MEGPYNMTSLFITNQVNRRHHKQGCVGLTGLKFHYNLHNYEDFPL